MRRWFQVSESGLLFDSQKCYHYQDAIFCVFMDELDLSCSCKIFYISVLGFACSQFTQHCEYSSKAQEVRVQEGLPQLLES